MTRLDRNIPYPTVLTNSPGSWPRRSKPPAVPKDPRAMQAVPFLCRDIPRTLTKRTVRRGIVPLICRFSYPPSQLLGREAHSSLPRRSPLRLETPSFPLCAIDAEGHSVPSISRGDDIFARSGARFIPPGGVPILTKGVAAQGTPLHHHSGGYPDARWATKLVHAHAEAIRLAALIPHKNSGADPTSHAAGSSALLEGDGEVATRSVTTCVMFSFY